MSAVDIGTLALWAHLFEERRGQIGLFSGLRWSPGDKKLEETRHAFFSYPDEQCQALDWLLREAARGREVYFCAHLLTARRRVKENAAPLSALYVDGDGAKARPGVPSPTAIVQTSRGREQLYWRLSYAVAPDVGETLNRRLALAMGADRSGWDLTQLLRPPGTPNHKYVEAPVVRMLKLADGRHDPGELDRMLPPLPSKRPKTPRWRCRSPEVEAAPDLSRLSRRMRDLILYGNRGEYGSRSEADMAACVAMFGASYSVSEIWAVMSNPTNGISQKFLEKGRHGERYLALTIGKAETLVQSSPRARQGKVYARRKGEVSIG